MHQKQRYHVWRSPASKMRNSWVTHAVGRVSETPIEHLFLFSTPGRGHNPERHPDWTDGSDLTAGQQGDIAFITPGVPQPGKKTSQQATWSKRISRKPNFCRILMGCRSEAKGTRSLVLIFHWFGAYPPPPPRHPLVNVGHLDQPLQRSSKGLPSCGEHWCLGDGFKLLFLFISKRMISRVVSCFAGVSLSD